MFREDQLDSNVEIGGGGQHMEKMQGLEKTEAAACLCFGQGNSKTELSWMDCAQKDLKKQFELAHRNVWRYIILKLRVVLAEYQRFLDSKLQDSLSQVKSKAPLFETINFSKTFMLHPTYYQCCLAEKINTIFL